MPAFTKGGGDRAPFGVNEYLRSTTAGVITESYMCSAASVPAETIDGHDQKVLQRGEVMAKITSGPEAGKVGPRQAGVTDGREVLENIVGITDTFLPWTLNERDCEIGVTVDCTAVQAWCYERDASGARVALSNATADAMYAQKRLDIKFA